MSVVTLRLAELSLVSPDDDAVVCLFENDDRRRGGGSSFFRCSKTITYRSNQNRRTRIRLLSSAIFAYFSSTNLFHRSSNKSCGICDFKL